MTDTTANVAMPSKAARWDALAAEVAAQHAAAAEKQAAQGGPDACIQATPNGNEDTVGALDAFAWSRRHERTAKEVARS